MRQTHTGNGKKRIKRHGSLPFDPLKRHPRSVTDTAAHSAKN